MCDLSGLELVPALEQDQEALPTWLETWPEQDNPRFDREDFLGCRTVYYPGSGYDGEPVRICNNASAAHAFIYVDSQVSPAEMRRHVHGMGDHSFSGYEIQHEEKLTQRTLIDFRWSPPADRWRLTDDAVVAFTQVPSGYFWVLGRRPDQGESHGPERFAMLFICADGHAMYEGIYCQDNNTPAPFLAVIQSHNATIYHDRFGRGGLLERIAHTYDACPQWLLVRSVDAQGASYEPWYGYTDMKVTPEVCHRSRLRCKLYRRGAGFS